MDMESLNKLEEKIKSLVDTLEFLKKENSELKHSLGELEKEKKLSSSEKEEIKNRVSSLINLIDSIKNENKRD